MRAERDGPHPRRTSWARRTTTRRTSDERGPILSAVTQRDGQCQIDQRAGRVPSLLPLPLPQSEPGLLRKEGVEHGEMVRIFSFLDFLSARFYPHVVLPDENVLVAPRAGELGEVGLGNHLHKVLIWGRGGEVG